MPWQNTGVIDPSMNTPSMNMYLRLIAYVNSGEIREGSLVVFSQLIKGLQLHQEHHL
jgi:hypothetical protein